MKLSMWMIANRLGSLLDIETQISPDAKPILNSARLVYSTNCVHVYRQGSYVVLDGEGDKIRLKEMGLKEAFEILQGIFDFYQDWESMIQEDIKASEFEKLVDDCWIVFQNPLMLMNANSQVLALTHNQEIGKMDQEWEYLDKYRYSSLPSMKFMLHNSPVDFDIAGCQSYKFSANSSMEYGGISYTLKFGGVYCGRINLLEKIRPLNAGDEQLLQKIADYLQPVLGIASDYSESMYSVFYDMLRAKAYNKNDLTHQLLYHNWNTDDNYQLMCLMPSDEYYRETSLNLLNRTLTKLMPDTVVVEMDSCVVVLANTDQSNSAYLTDTIQRFCVQSNLKAGIAMTYIGLEQLKFMYRQALYAINRGKLEQPEEYLYHFSDFSLNYILESPDPADKVQACHPVIRKLWKLKNEQSDELYDTLKVYLDNERSLSKTSTALFTHRNTVLYRIKKCQEYLKEDFESPRTRYYIRLSMYILESVVNG